MRDGCIRGPVDPYHKGVVEGGKDVGNPKDELARTHLGTQSDVLLDLGLAGFLEGKDG